MVGGPKLDMQSVYSPVRMTLGPPRLGPRLVVESMVAKVGMQVSHPLSKNDNRVAQTLSAIWSRLLAVSTQTFFGLAVFPPMLSQSSDVERFVNNPIVWPWFRDRYMMGGSLARNWSSNVKKYLCEEVLRLKSRKRKPNDGPALQAFCSALGGSAARRLHPGPASRLRRETHQPNLPDEGFPCRACIDGRAATSDTADADTPMPDTSAELPACAVEVEGSTPAKRVCTEQTALEPIGAAPTHEATPVKRPEPEWAACCRARRCNATSWYATPVRPDTYLSPSAALRLSQSCRKSPLSEPSFAAHPDSLPPQAGAARRQLAAVIRDTRHDCLEPRRRRCESCMSTSNKNVRRRATTI